tara:strand:+ start:55 stop:915 length:861 start_codon:yes stop_codon:yes gene_type:complete
MSRELNKLLDEKLAEATPPAEIKYRQAKYGLTEGESVQMLAYIDARYVMQRLDEVFGVANWANEYILIGAKTFCKLSATFPDGTVVSKMDVGAETDFEQEKGVVSDALKRTAVLFGIGRDLYSLPKYWAEAGHNGFVSKDWRPPSARTDISSNPPKAGGVSHSDSTITPITSPPASSVQQKANEVVANLVKNAPDAPSYNRPQMTQSPPAQQNNAPDILTIKGVELKASSQKAIMVEQNGSGEVWIPNSQIKNKTVSNVGDIGSIDIPGWLADKNGLTADNDEIPF